MNAPADRLAIALAQLNPTVGDVTGNAEKVRRARAQAKEQGAELVIFPELFIAGYPPEDLVLKPAFQAACRSAVEALARETADGGPAVLVGAPWVDEKKLYNAYLLLEGGKIAAARYKVELPNYGVFDEKRVFESGPLPGPIVFKGVRIGIPICEDIWHADVVECISETGGEILLVPNGSPYHRDKTEVRLNIAVSRVVESGLPLVYLNMVGGQDELVFDGSSFALNADRSIAFQLPCVPRNGRHHAMGARERHLALPAGREGADRRGRRSGLCGLRARAARLRRTRTASRAWCSASRAASTRRCAPRWRSMRSVRSACAP